MFLDRLRVFVVAVMVLAAAGTGSGLVAYRVSAAEVDEPPVSEVTPARPPVVPPGRSLAPPPPVVAEAAPEPGVYRTNNFEVRAPTDEIARRIARAAERERRVCARHWLGRELPAWPQRCPVRVTITGAGSGGATSFAFDRGRVVSMNMHVEGPLDRLLDSVVPHEVAHTVFAHYFRCPVPRWADEGGALQSEDAAERQRHDRLCRRLLNNGDALTLRAMFGLTDYPEDVMTLYAEGYAVTRFLVEKKDPGTFLAFVAHGMHHDWDAAVRKYYGYEDVDDLQAAWLAAMRRKGGAAAKAAAPSARVTPDAADLRDELDDLRDQVRLAEKDLQRMEDSLKQKRQELGELRRRIERLTRRLDGR